MGPLRKAAAHGGYVAAAATALFFTHACVEEEPTGVSRNGSNVIREYTNGCVPEVLESSSEDTDTILVTFDGPFSDNCVPKLAQWGIDMADPVGVDTPQGNQLYQLNHTNMANLPLSPSGAGLQNNAVRVTNGSPPQVMVEFDPPVSSVEFYYSFPFQGRAYWNGTFADPADSVQVFLASRIPGTLNYNPWYFTKLYSNNPVLVPPALWSVWTKVILKPGRPFQWLWFNGLVSIDHLKITRKPLQCPSPVVKWSETKCTFTSQKWSVTGWEFHPDSTAGGPLPPVVEALTVTEWSGEAVIGGEVIVHVQDVVGNQRDYSTRVEVVPQSSQWLSMQTYRQGTVSTDLTAPDVEPDIVKPGATIGMNCAEPPVGCEPTLRLQPDPERYMADDPTGNSPVVIARVTSGRNKGYWGVKSAKWNMKRVGNVTPGIRIESQRVHASIPTTKKCKSSSQLRNFYRYSLECQGINMANFVDAALRHEGFGNPATGARGHESLGRAAAAEPGNDPYVAHLGIVLPDSASVASQVQSSAVQIGYRLSERSDDNPNTESTYPTPGGNWGPGPWWVWPPTQVSWSSFNINGF
jgi:hypothetical protein